MRRVWLKGRSKYGATPVEVDGIRFMSKAEGLAYQQLKLALKSGQIHALYLQPKFPLVVDGTLVCTYVADFMTYTQDGEVQVIDVKGVRTGVYRLKAKLFQALHGFPVTEWAAKGLARRSGRG